tara:strand:+ start:2721 stop:3233 length:513 start_codon:yes stop_codon:yes gene_type:complete
MQNHKTFFTADLHLGHSKIIEFEPERQHFSSIEEHDQQILNNWNSVVNKKDTVWVLGDVCFKKEKLELLGAMNGFKKLVLGNHDRLATENYLKYFSKVYGAVEYKDCLLTHIPVHESQKSRYKYNIHGHLHSVKIDDPFYINVSLEQYNLYPVELKRSLWLRKKRVVGKS